MFETAFICLCLFFMCLDSNEREDEINNRLNKLETKKD
mgnify:CR=1 FL=1